MKILGIESADPKASIALVEDNKIIDEMISSGKITHSETLMPMLDQIVKRSNFDLKTLDAIAISKGPGSYTGLRIGASTAKGLAMIIKKPIVPVSTLGALAYHYYGSDYIVVPMLDARNNNVFASAYCFEPNGNDFELCEIFNEDLYRIEELLTHAKLQSTKLSKEIVFLGSGAVTHRELIASKLPDNSYIASSEHNTPMASLVSKYGAKLFNDGKSIEGKDFAPSYLRPSSATRNRKE